MIRVAVHSISVTVNLILTISVTVNLIRLNPWLRPCLPVAALVSRADLARLRYLGRALAGWESQSSYSSLLSLALLKLFKVSLLTHAINLLIDYCKDIDYSGLVAVREIHQYDQRPVIWISLTMISVA